MKSGFLEDPLGREDGKGRKRGEVREQTKKKKVTMDEDGGGEEGASKGERREESGSDGI